MNIITKKVRLVPAPFVGTRITINLTNNPTFTLCQLQLAELSSSVTIDWGDGVVESFGDSAVCRHTYPSAGLYVIKISDDVAILFSQSEQDDTDKKAIIAIESNAETMDSILTGAFSGCSNLASLEIDASKISSIGYSAFKDCASLPPFLNLHNVNNLISRLTLLPFSGCTNIREIHFSKANEEAIMASSAYKTDPTLGTGVEGICRFDP